MNKIKFLHFILQLNLISIDINNLKKLNFFSICLEKKNIIQLYNYDILVK